MTANSWLQSGLTEVLLPTGYRVRGKRPDVGELFRLGVFPAHLLQAVVKLADPSWLQDPDDGAERMERAAEAIDVLVANFPRDVWDEDAGWERITEPIAIEDLAEDDVDALQRVMLGLWTPDTATAMAEHSLGLRDEPPEEGGGLPDWATFRRERRRAAADHDSGGVGGAAESDAGGAGPADSDGAGRGAGGPEGDREDASGDPGEREDGSAAATGRATAGGDALRDRGGHRAVVAA